MDERYGKVYRDLYEHHWWWRARERLILATLSEILPRTGGARILDVGCGDGLLFDRLMPFGEVEGLETEAWLNPVGRWAHAIHITPFDQTFQPGREYSAILLLDVLEHVDRPEDFLRRAQELLAPGGRLLITVPAFMVLWTRHDELNHHRTRYTKRSLLPLVTAAGFTVSRARYYFQGLFAAKLAVRLVERLRGGTQEAPRVPARWINQMVLAGAIVEHAIASRLPFPFGSSLLVAATKVDDPSARR